MTVHLVYRHGTLSVPSWKKECSIGAGSENNSSKNDTLELKL